jgi:hypothetical protein
VTEVECCACHRRVAVDTAQTIAVIGVHGDDLPIPSYVHCGACMLRMPPAEAWLLANAEMRRIIGRRD